MMTPPLSHGMNNGETWKIKLGHIFSSIVIVVNISNALLTLMTSQLQSMRKPVYVAIKS